MPGVWGDGVARSRAQGSGRDRHAERAGSVDHGVRALGDGALDGAGVAHELVLGGLGHGAVVVQLEGTDAHGDALRRHQLDLVLGRDDDGGHLGEVHAPALAIGGGLAGRGAGVGVGGRDLAELDQERGGAGDEHEGVVVLPGERVELLAQRVTLRLRDGQFGETGLVDEGHVALLLGSLQPVKAGIFAATVAITWLHKSLPYYRL